MKNYVTNTSFYNIVKIARDRVKKPDPESILVVPRQWVSTPWQHQQYQSGIPASFTEPPTLKRDGPKQTRERTAETVLLE